MKKIFLLLIVVSACILLGLQFVQAGSPGKTGCGLKGCDGPENCQLTSAEAEEKKDFFEETAKLREEMFELRREYIALMSEDEPDKDYAEQLWSEMFDIQSQLRQKAEQAGIEMGYGRGCGNRGPGDRKGGCGPKNCPQNGEQDT